MKDEKNRGGGEGRGVYTRRALACCWHKEKRGEKKKENIYTYIYIMWLYAHFIYIHTHIFFSALISWRVFHVAALS